MDFKESVEKLLNEALTEQPDLFLIKLTIGADHSIRVTLDGDKGVTLEQCMQVSRKIEHNLDREEVDFSLEVGSVGVGSPLVQTRQFIKNIGRKLEVKSENAAFKGNLVQADDQAIVLEWKAREPKPVGKGKVTVTKTKTIEYSLIDEAKVILNL